MGVYTVEINGEQFSTTFKSKSEAAVLSGLKKKYAKVLKNSKYGDSLKASDIDNILGNPKKSRPDQVFQRKDSQTLSSPQTETSEATQPGSQMGENLVSSVPSEEENKMIKGRPRNHIPWQVSNQNIEYDGLGDTALYEPNPEIFRRPGDDLLLGANNTSIVLGRDHSPQNSMIYSKSLQTREYNSGFSDHMGAGAIDIVAGRMAPFALEKLGGDQIAIAPSFNTSFPPEVAGIQLEGGTHPGMVMDAARIYISQMTAIDENFKITKKVRSSDTPTNTVAPTSGIMLKADKVRLHSRQDIKIVTGGPHERWNSQGNRVKQKNGIHLIAQNGVDLDETRKMTVEIPQHPMVLGDNLVECLEAMLDLTTQVSQRMDHFVESQMRFNAIASAAFHMMPVPSGITIPNPQEVWSGIIAVLEGLNNRLDAFKTEINNFNRRTNYLQPGTDKYINSKYNTVN
tara:strand:+ start:629 stop:1996 length:1368 start_codon:yes stop_codon:yes gene_type:complete